MKENRIWFTSDWHLGDDRLGINNNPNVLLRPFKSVSTQTNTILSCFLNSGFKDGDTLYHLGDVVYQIDESVTSALQTIRGAFPNSKLCLTLGNYDERNIGYLYRFFDKIENDYTIDESPLMYLNHYPDKCSELMQDAQLGITGHVHGAWRVRRHLINVGVDAWHFDPVPIETIRFVKNAMDHHYDENIFI